MFAYLNSGLSSGFAVSVMSLVLPIQLPILGVIVIFALTDAPFIRVPVAENPLIDDVVDPLAAKPIAVFVFTHS